MGFHIYGLHRFIGSSFDVYFHLWSNGVPHWEREKRLWELDQEKGWTRIVSKRQKRQAKQTSQFSQKKVRYAETLVQGSPPAKHKPHALIRLGTFNVPVLKDSLVSLDLSFGRSAY